MADLGQGLLELGQVLEVFIDGGETDVRDFVEALEFLHDELADIAGVDLAPARRGGRHVEGL